MTNDGTTAQGLNRNLDTKTVAGFGDEWSRFDQRELEDAEARAVFEQYFAVFPWASLPAGAIGMDLGCGSGRWARLMAERDVFLHCVDASPEAIEVARRNLASCDNARFHVASVANIPLPDASLDFGYSLGVLHHVPDTAAGIAACVRKLKPGAPLLLYLYYAFDNRPHWFRMLWEVSDRVRRVVSDLPHEARYAVSQVLAWSAYLPLARTAAALERLGVDVTHFPLASYRNRSLYVMRTDALDRFGTALEQRFTRDQIRAMMTAAGLERIEFGHNAPFWTAVGFRTG